MPTHNCCCKTKIGFDNATTWFTTFNSGCNAGITTLLNLATDISRIGECKLVYAGLRCGVDGARKAVIFDSGDWPAVRSYIEGGGRLMLSAENALTAATWDDALTNSFLTAMGSTMQWAGGSYEGTSGLGLGCDAENFGVVATANIAHGLSGNPASGLYGNSPVLFSLTGAVSGGTPVFRGPQSGQVIFAVEKLGDGFLFFNADNAIYNCCPIYSSCEFLDRLYTFADASIL